MNLYVIKLSTLKFGLLSLAYSISCMQIFSAEQSNLTACLSEAISHNNTYISIVRKLTPDETLEFLVKNKQFDSLAIPSRIDNRPYAKPYNVDQHPCSSRPFIVVHPSFLRLPLQRLPEESWRTGCGEGKDCLFLIIYTTDDQPPFDKNRPYLIDFPDIQCGFFQIKDDPLDNRLGVDLELLYEDLQLIISHRPDWASVPAGQLKTDFAKAVLARLLGEVESHEDASSLLE